MSAELRHSSMSSPAPGLAIVGTVGVPARYGGFETLAEHLSIHCVSQGFRTTVTCESKAYPDATAKADEWKGVVRLFLRTKANGFMSLIHDAFAIAITTRRNETVLLLGVSGAWFLPLARLISRTRFVTNIDGLEHKRAKWGPVARNALRALEALAVKFSHEVICDNASLVDYVHRTYARSSRLIAYGGYTASDEEALDSFGSLERLGIVPYGYLLGLCRVEPENHVEEILEGYAKSGRRHPLVFVGNWGRGAYGEDLRRRYGSIEGITLLDPIYDPTVVFNLRKYSLAYLHGHSAGGTNPSLVEALTTGTHTICYDVDYNRNTTHGRGSFFDSPEALSRALDALLPAPDLETRRANARAARLEYDWRTIGDAYVEAMRGAAWER